MAETTIERERAIAVCLEGASAVVDALEYEEHVEARDLLDALATAGYRLVPDDAAVASAAYFSSVGLE